MSNQQYFAELDANNIVIDIAVTTPEFMAENPERYSGRWVETFYDRPDKTYAGVGYTYDDETDDFYGPPIVEPQ